VVSDKMALAKGEEGAHGSRRVFASPEANAGLMLLALGIAGLLTYITLRLPVAVFICALLILAGAALVNAELRISDVTPLGVSLAECLASIIRNYKKVWSRLVVLIALPDVSGADVELVLKRLFNKRQLHTIYRTDERRLSNPEVVGTTDVGQSGSVVAENNGSAWDLSMQWLREPRLDLGLLEQLHLYGLYRQASAGDAPYMAPRNSPVESAELNSGSALARAKAQSWRALRGLPRTMARAQLPGALAQFDSRFAALQPHLAPQGQASDSLAAIAFGLLERRLLVDFDQTLARVHHRLLSMSVVATVLTTLWAGWLRLARGKGAQTRRWLLASLLSSFSSTYLFSLVHGLPASLHAIILLRRRGPALSLGPTAAHDSMDVTARIRRLLALMLLPRVSHSLLAGAE